MTKITKGRATIKAMGEMKTPEQRFQHAVTQMQSQLIKFQQRSMDHMMQLMQSWQLTMPNPTIEALKPEYRSPVDSVKQAVVDGNISNSEAKSIVDNFKLAAKTLADSPDVQMDSATKDLLDAFAAGDKPLPHGRSGRNLPESHADLLQRLADVFTKATSDGKLTGDEAGEILALTYESLRSLAMTPSIEISAEARDTLSTLVPKGEVDIPITTFYAVGEEGGGPIGGGDDDIPITTFYAVGEEGGGPIDSDGPGITTFYGIGEESGGPIE